MSDTSESEGDIYGSLGDVTDCATCPREAAGERLTTLEHLDGYERVWRIHLCRYCNRAFDLGEGNAPMMDGEGPLAPECDGGRLCAHDGGRDGGE